MPPSAGSRATGVAAADADGTGVVANDEVRGLPSSFRTTATNSPRTASAAGDRTGSSMGPRTTRQALAPPSEGIVTPTEGAGGGTDADGGADTGGEAATDETAGADADGSAGPAFPGDPLHAARTAKTSHHGARTPLLYYA